MINMTYDLKPCPFCGGAPEAGIEYSSTDSGVVRHYARIRCKQCGIDKSVRFKATCYMRSDLFMPIEHYIDTFESLIEKWNTRVPDALGDEWKNITDKIYGTGANT